MHKTAFITGATSGIGLAAARLFARHNFNLVICGRRMDRLEKIKNELINASVHILNFDVSSHEQTLSAITGLPEQFQKIDVLINNAGNAHGLDNFQDADIQDWENMIDTNVKGLLYVSRAILPGMIKRKSGHIINIASIAGKEVYSKGNVYCASKHAVQALSDAMRIDLIKEGIKVSSISPGLVETEFSEVRFKGDKQRAKEIYKGLNPLTPEDIAEILLFTATRPPHVNISDLTVLATAQASASIVHRKNDL